MNIKAKLYLLSVILALVAVCLAKITHNGFLYCMPLGVLYLTALYYLDNIRSSDFGYLFFFLLKLYAIFHGVAVSLVISFQKHPVGLPNFLKIAFINIALALILSVTQIPFILKALKNK